MFLKVRDFFTQHAADFPPDTIGATLFAALLSIIEQIEQAAAQKVSAIGEVGQSIDVKGDAKDAFDRSAQRHSPHGACDGV
jgi:hypothetical protein